MLREKTMPVIRLREGGTLPAYGPGKTLLEILAEAGVMPPSPCGGTGTCGKCTVTILAGRVADPTEDERRLFSEEELAAGRRLACQVFPEEDLEVGLSGESASGDILSEGYLPAFALDPPLAAKTVSLDATITASHEERVAAALKQINFSKLICSGGRAGGRPLAGSFGSPSVIWFHKHFQSENALREKSLPARLLRDLPQAGGRLTAMYDEGELIALESGDGPKRLCGLAVDIGTTTVVAALVDLKTGRELAVRSAINPQKSRGFDVLSRLSFIMEHPGRGLPALQRAVVDCLNELAEKACREAGTDINAVYAVTVAANTAMMHILLGVDPSSLGMTPFTPVFTNAKKLPAAEIGLRAAKGAGLYCLPSVSAFIGADIVAGIHVAGLRTRRETVLFVDIGTNGEIVLSHDGRLYACSCAAGPALEGMNISCGMRAAPGAVEDVRITESGLALKTIGNAPPAGLCGSGVLSAVREFLRIGLIRPRGNLVKERELDDDDPRKAYLCSRDDKPALRLPADGTCLYITQKDIRQVQLAKGALLSGILSLPARSGLTVDDIDRVFIAGQFGAHLPASSLTGCGIIPEALGEKIAYLGNTSKSGALMALLSTAVRREMESLTGDVDYLELSSLEGFERTFVECLDFPTPPS